MLITYRETLLYYDGVQVFEAIDTSGNLYAAVRVDDNDNFVIVKLPEEHICAFIHDRITPKRLMDLMEKEPEWYLVRVASLVEIELSTPQTKALSFDSFTPPSTNVPKA